MTENNTMCDQIPITLCRECGVAVHLRSLRLASGTLMEEQNCPKCFRIEHAVRVAQFGGVGGGGGGSFAPGRSPFGSGSGGGVGINESVVDEGLDAIMGKTRQNPAWDDKTNIEMMLEPFHDYAEEDLSKYNLSFEERQKLKIKQQIRRREQYILDSARSIKENSVDYIKEHFKPKAEHLRTMEESLGARRLHDPKARHPREDESPAQDRATRYHEASRAGVPRRAQVNNHMTNTVFGPQDDGEDEVQEFRTSTMPMGPTPVLDTTDQQGSSQNVDQYMKDSAEADWGGQPGPGVQTMMDHTAPDQWGDHSAPPTDPIGSALTDLDAADDPFLGMEGKLQKQKYQQPQSVLNRDPYSRTDQDAWEGSDPRGLADTYNVGKVPDLSGGHFNSIT